MKRTVLICLSMLFALSCKSPDAATQILILVDADQGVQMRVTSLRVRLQGRRSGDISDAQFAEYGPGGLPLEFPLRVAVVPRGNDATRTLDVAIEASDADGVFIRSDVVTGFVANATLALRITLTSACIDSTCSADDGETCQPDGTCGPIERPVLPPFDGGMDAGAPDGGTLDGSTLDGSDPLDAGDATVVPGCSPEGARCNVAGDALIRCEAGVEMVEACTCGVRDEDSRCLLPMPRNVTDEDVLDFSAPADFETMAGDMTVFDTDNGAIRVNGMLVRAGTGGLSADIVFASQVVGGTLDTVAIWGFNSLHLRGTVTFEGDSPAILVASGDIEIAGHIELSAEGRTPGIGGQPGGDGVSGLPDGMGGVSPVPTSSNGTGAAGGAGGLTQGGGPGTDAVRGEGMAGEVAPNTAEPLMGGASGGGATVGALRSVGGGGGGAIQFFSRTSIRVTEDGIIAAHGGGGGSQGVFFSGGAGGGAGGVIVLEAPDVTIVGGVYANGGGGGSGTYRDEPGNAGNDGQDGDVQAAGAEPINNAAGAGDGGDGGTAALAPTNGEIPSSVQLTAGGGGGAAGRIFIAGDRLTVPTGAILLDLQLE